MVYYNESTCPSCGGELSYYDQVLRRIKTGNGEIQKFKMRRLKCKNCTKVHREITDEILPFKHYNREVIKGVINGWITSSTIGYEDYPTELTMNRWIKNFSTYFDMTDLSTKNIM